MKVYPTEAIETFSSRFLCNWGTSFSKTVFECSVALHHSPPILGDLPTQVELAGAKPVYIDTRENAYRFSADLFDKAITAATKAIIINSPMASKSSSMRLSSRPPISQG